MEENKITTTKTSDYCPKETFLIVSEPFISYSSKNPLEEFDHTQELADKNVLIHRFYGVIEVLDLTYRVKTTIKEYRDINYINKPYSFEVIKIELLDLSNSSISVASHPNSLGGLITNVANILQNIEKSYDKGKFLLEESRG